MDMKRLVDLCLESIVCNIQHMCALFDIVRKLPVKYPVHRRNFDFLQRVYANKLYKEVSKIGLLSNSHLPLVMNKYLTEINFMDVANCTPELLDKYFNVVAEGLIKLNLRTVILSHVSPFFFDNVIRNLQNVQYLYLGSHCDDFLMEAIGSSCQNLLELDISLSSVTDLGLGFLVKRKYDGAIGNPLLRVLRMSHVNVSNETVALLLDTLTFMEEIYYERLPLVLYEMYLRNEKDNFVSVRFYNLKKLEILLPALEFLCQEQFDPVTLPPFSSLLLACTILCPNINSLVSYVLKEDDFKLLSKFPDIKRAILNCSQAALRINVNLFITTCGSSLKFLSLTVFLLSMELLAINCVNLNRLWLMGTNFQAIETNEICKLNRLQELHLACYSFKRPTTIKAIKLLLESCPNLRVLKITNCTMFHTSILQTILKVCCSCPLQEISFMYCHVDALLKSSILRMSKSFKIVDIDNIWFDPHLLSIFPMQPVREDVSEGDYLPHPRMCFYIEN